MKIKDHGNKNIPQVKTPCIMYQTQKSSNLKRMKILTCYFLFRVDGKVYFIDYDFGRDGVKDLG